MRALLLILCLLLLGIACQPPNPAIVVSDKPVSILFQPFQGIDTAISTKVYNYIKTASDNNCQLLPVIELPPASYISKLKRYKADSVISYLKKGFTEKNQILVGLTPNDIETSLDGKAHWGIMGLGYCPGTAAIISTYRLQKGAPSNAIIAMRTINVSLHEMGHNFSLPHCVTKNCLMRAAHGQMPLDTIGQFCPECLKTLQQKGWKYRQPPTTYSQHTENK